MERFETFWKKYSKTAVEPRRVLLGPNTLDNKVKVEDCKAAYSHALSQAKDEIKRLEIESKNNHDEVLRLTDELRRVKSKEQTLTE